jgi:DNA-binding transcriptional ArsR family regulator
MPAAKPSYPSERTKRVADSAAFQRKAVEAADLLRALGNKQRLMVLCKLVEWGEANVTQLAKAVALSQSALSQHLARMREEHIVAFRRDARTVWYRICDPRTEELLTTLYRLFCGAAQRPKKKAATE